MSQSKLLLAGVLAALAFISWWLDSQVVPKLTEPDPLPGHEPDYFLETFSITTMNEQGTPNYILAGERLVHFQDDDTAEITRPHLQFIRTDAPKWIAEAEHAWVSPRGEHIHLIGQVIMIRENFDNQPAVRINTRDLRIRRHDHYAETDQPVHVESAGRTVDSVGMKAWLDTGRLSLISQVRGHYIEWTN